MIIVLLLYFIFISSSPLAVHLPGTSRCQEGETGLLGRGLLGRPELHLLVIICVYLLPIFREGHPARGDAFDISGFSGSIILSFVEECLLVVKPAEHPLLLVVVYVSDVSVQAVVQGLPGNRIDSPSRLLFELLLN